MNHRMIKLRKKRAAFMETLGPSEHWTFMKAENILTPKGGTVINPFFRVYNAVMYISLLKCDRMEMNFNAGSGNVQHWVSS